MSTTATVVVPLACRRVRSGEIDLHAMAVGYLAAFTVATGTQIEGELSEGTIDRRVDEQLKWLRDEKGFLRPRPEPVFPVVYPEIPVPIYREEMEFPPDGEYGLPTTRRGYSWGTAQCGVRTTDLSDRLGITWWHFDGLPNGCTLTGENRLQVDYASYAQLTLCGPTRWVTRVSEAFLSALTIYDQRHEPDGATAAALEQAISQRVKDSHHGPWEEIDTTALEAVIGTTDVDSPVGAAARFWLVVVAMGRGKFELALEILHELHSLGEWVAFSHGINVFYNPDGTPLTVGWQDHFPPPFPHDEIWLAQAVVLAGLGMRDQALMQLRTIAMAQSFTSHTQAAALVDAMTTGVDELQTDWDEAVAEHHRPVGIRAFYERRAPVRFAEWKAAADADDWRAQSLVSDSLFFGLGAAVNLTQGAEYARLAAHHGHPTVVMNWAMILIGGVGCDANKAEGEALTIEAAEAAEARACANCGLICKRGEGNDNQPDHASALMWFRLGAEGGSLLAQAQYGAYQLAGWGGEVDAPSAVRWLTIAATRGSAPAQDNLAVAYLDGSGVPQSDADAFAWFLKAAEQGVNRAQLQVSEMYSEGRGVEADPVASARWRAKAAKQG
ncbi:MAG: hypothetical protein K8U57_25105 [Planctomycetes bacterium]|nr:hypothetical protein [Planctomycetota bacterium]